MIWLLLWFWLVGFLLLFRVPHCPRAVAVADTGRLSVIIPARDEAGCLPTLLASLRDQEAQPLEVIVVDDASADRTALIAREYGATVIEPGALPDGWRGKAWACHQGANAARGDTFMFVDADTRLEAGGLARIMGVFKAAPGVLSVGPYHRVVRPYESLSAYFNLVMTMGMGRIARPGRPTTGGLFGPCLVVDRGDYNESDGHAAVRGQVLENLFMADAFHRCGIATRCCLGKGILCMRMYPNGPADLVAGWRKAFAAGATRTDPPTLLLICVWLCGACTAGLLPVVAVLLDGDVMQSLRIYALFAGQAGLMLARIGTFWLPAWLVFPVPLCFYVFVFGHSLILQRVHGAVAWKGRVFHADAAGEEAPGAN